MKNLGQMMKQVQQMQAEMAKAEQQLKNEVVEASAGGGMVTVKVSGSLELRDEVVDDRAEHGTHCAGAVRGRGSARGRAGPGRRGRRATRRGGTASDPVRSGAPR